jgi:hypothetical protein
VHVNSRTSELTLTHRQRSADAPVGLVLRVDQLRLDEAQRFAANPALLELVGGNLARDVREAVEARQDVVHA